MRGALRRSEKSAAAELGLAVGPVAVEIPEREEVILVWSKTGRLRQRRS